MGIYPTSGNLGYHVNGSKLDTSLNFSPGTYNAVVQEWDNCGSTSKTTVKITVSSSTGNEVPPSTPSGNVFKDLQAQSGWNTYALLRSEKYGLCTHCNPAGPKTIWSTKLGVGDPSMDGKSTKYSIGGNEAYDDYFWNNKLIGDFSSQGLPDKSRTLVAKYHDFTYDVWFFGSDLEKSQALEFDINQFYSGRRFIWGHECRIAAGHEWDSWDNNSEHWVNTGIPCNPKSNAWNHLVIKVKRIDDNTMQFVSVTLNDKVGVENRTDTVLKRDGWYGLTINYQMDLNKNADDYTVYLDKLNFYYQ